ncbi:MAG: carboxynorspermidine decarboxylase [Proteobacteria bacterium]|nr:carboxynorspermidine decarboxylase [Pseudomonadota bacterium]MBU1714955.1 carboxynorspermidine decarboxylase [Pseudomonadota bacterium]
MDDNRFSRLDLKTPCYLVDQQRIEENCRILAGISERTGCKILLALKGFAMFSLFPLISKYLQGVCASGLLEARLGREEFNGEVHTFSPAFRQEEFARISELSDHIVFNSWPQFQRYGHLAKNCQIGLRINPEYSEVETLIYNPCAPGSRLGILAKDLQGKELTGIDGLHFHVMCEQGADTLERVLAKVEEKFGHLLPAMKWLNFGGGHHITRPGYELDLLCRLIKRFRDKYDLQIYLEPGEAIALNAGVLVASVLDLVHNEIEIAILDTSAEAHMPDVLAMPYRPELIGAKKPQELAHTYRLAGNTCLAGDVIGDYSFATPLQVGQKLVFTDMAHYTMVKNTTFNGIGLPTIAIFDNNTDSIKIIREFGYKDFRDRLS